MFSRCLRVCACVCGVCVWVHSWIYAHTWRNREGHQVSSCVALYLFLWDRDSLWTCSLLIWLSMADYGASRISLSLPTPGLRLQVCTITLSLHVGSGNLNSGSGACAEMCLPTKPSLLPSSGVSCLNLNVHSNSTSMYLLWRNREICPELYSYIHVYWSSITKFEDRPGVYQLEEEIQEKVLRDVMS